MTRRRQRTGRKGYFCEAVCVTRRSESRMLTTPPGARQPATGDAIGGCLVPVAEVELGENALHVVLDRVLADHQTLGDLGVGEARRHQLQHLQLSGSELFLWPERLILAPNLFQDPGSHATRD